MYFTKLFSLTSIAAGLIQMVNLPMEDIKSLPNLQFDFASWLVPNYHRAGRTSGAVETSGVRGTIGAGKASAPLVFRAAIWYVKYTPPVYTLHFLHNSILLYSPYTVYPWCFQPRPKVPKTKPFFLITLMYNKLESVKKNIFQRVSLWVTS